MNQKAGMNLYGSALAQAHAERGGEAAIGQGVSPTEPPAALLVRVARLEQELGALKNALADVIGELQKRVANLESTVLG